MAFLCVCSLSHLFFFLLLLQIHVSPDELLLAYAHLCVVSCEPSYSARTTANSPPAWPRPKQNRKITSLWFIPLVVLPPLVTKLSLSLSFNSAGKTIGLWLTSTPHKGLVQMSRDVYYKGLDLKRVGEIGPLAASTLRVCLRALTQGAGVCL